MIICVDISQRTKDELEGLLEIGQYRDYSEAIAVAVANQLLLHTHAEASGSRMAEPEVIAERPKERESNAPRSKAEATSSTTDVPQLFAALDQAAKTPVLAPFPNDLFAMGQGIPVDRWIFGQHNKLLPVKATCRALARLMQSDSRESLRLTKAASEIASEAVRLGDYLRHIDRVSEIHRDDALSFAFPYTDSPNGDKSRLRYANQFVASFTKQGTLAGLPIELKLANRDHSRNPQLLLTEAGWRFALMTNPILDFRKDGTQPRFSDDEVGFMIDHIRAHVPAEAFAFGAVLMAVMDGANTPEKLDDALQKYLPKRNDKPFTRAFLTTQRAGVVSRMIDLGLLQRLRDGINVTYAATAKGSEYPPTFAPEATK
jgi:hypothetical protein